MNKFKDFYNKYHISVLISVGATLFFVVYNAYLGIAKSLIWNLAISIYYFVLLIIKFICFGEQFVCIKRNKDYSLKVFIVCSILTMGLTLVLTAPAIMMLKDERPVNLGLIPAIAVAAYTTYKITMAIIRYCKYKKNKTLYGRQITVINIIAALVSVLTLQNTLIHVTGGNLDEMKTVCLSSTIAILLLIVVLSIKALIDGIKISKYQR